MRRDLREQGSELLGVLGRACMAKGLAGTKAEGNLKKRNETVGITLES